MRFKFENLENLEINYSEGDGRRRTFPNAYVGATFAKIAPIELRSLLYKIHNQIKPSEGYG